MDKYLRATRCPEGSPLERKRTLEKHPGDDWDVVSMLITIEFEFSLYCFDGCRQFRVSTYPLGRTANGRAVYIKPAGHFAYGDRQILRGNKADQGASTCDCRMFFRAGQSFVLNVKTTVNGSVQRG